METATGQESVRGLLDRLMASYDEVEKRFAGTGGIGNLVAMYEQVRCELDRISYEELDAMTREIKTVIDTLLKMDYELRKVHNLKLAFDGRQPESGA